MHFVGLFFLQLWKCTVQKTKYNYFLCIYESKIYKPKLMLLASSKIVFSSSCKIFTLALHSSTSTMWGCTAWITWNKKVLGYTCYAINGTFTCFPKSSLYLIIQWLTDWSGDDTAVVVTHTTTAATTKLDVSRLR